MVDTGANKETDGQADVWVNNRKWDVEERNIDQRRLGAGARGTTVVDVEWWSVLSTGWCGSQCKVAMSSKGSEPLFLVLFLQFFCWDKFYASCIISSQTLTASAWIVG